MKRIWEPSYQRGLRLAKLGVELPYLDDLPGKKQLDQRALYISTIGGYAQNLIIDDEECAEYVIALRIGTDRSREIVRSFSFTPPWPEQKVSWAFDPAEEFPKRVSENMLAPYKKLFDARLPGIFNDRTDLYGGCPVEGLLFGRASRPIPASVPREPFAIGELVVLSGSGVRVRTPIHFSICLSQQRVDAMRADRSSADLKILRAANRDRLEKARKEKRVEI